MSMFYKGLNYGGSQWTPQFVTSIDPAKCIGCGRCVKVCSQSCLGVETFMDEDDMERMIASIANKDYCIGCQACGRTCTKKAYSFEPKEI